MADSAHKTGHSGNRPYSDHSQRQISNQYQPMHPPVPFQQFEYSFPPTFPVDQLLPHVPPESSATADLFSATEHTNLLGFLDQFEWQFDPLLPTGLPSFNAPTSGNSDTAARHPSSQSQSVSSRGGPHSSSPPLVMTGGSVQHHTSTQSSPMRSNNPQISGSVYMAAPPGSNSYPPPSTTAPFQSVTHIHSHRQTSYTHALPPQPKLEPTDDGNPNLPDDQQQQSLLGGSADLPNDDPSNIRLVIPGSESTGETSSIGVGSGGGGGNLAGGRPQKPVLTTPEKRVRHILSEQRRRNTIRDGYTQLTTMLAPHPSAVARPAPVKPPRGGPGGRPKGARGRTRGKGKSGVLFKAVEYIRWLQESVEDLTAEVVKLEAATGSLVSMT